MTAADHRRRRIASFMTLAFEELKAAEKLLRAVLEIESIPAGPTHNLRTLADLLDKGHALKPEFLAVEEWSSAATRFRYPSGSGAAPTASPAMLRDRHATGTIGAGCEELCLRESER